MKTINLFLILVTFLATLSSCNEVKPIVLEDDFTVRSEQDLIDIQDVQIITGNLTFEIETLDTINLPNLETIEGKLKIQDNFNVVAILLPSLSYADSIVITNTDIQYLNITNIKEVRIITVLHNPLLPQCLFEGLFDDMQNINRDKSIIEGNDETATCN